MNNKIFTIDAEVVFKSIMQEFKSKHADDPILNRFKLVVDKSEKKRINKDAELCSDAYHILSSYEPIFGFDIPSDLMVEMKNFIRCLNPNIQFLVAENFIDFFTDGDVRFTGLQYVDSQLLLLYASLMQTVIPIAAYSRS